MTLSEFAVGDLLAVDPGLNSPGAALFRGGVLIAAERVRIPKELADLGRGERCARVASTIIRWAMANNAEPRVLVYEFPQIYTRTKSKGDPNDLLGLVGVGAELGGQLSMALVPRSITLVRITPTPAEWVQQLPKGTRGDPWTSPRGQRIKSRLSAEEFAVVVPTHDALDAVGLGLWCLGRFAPVRVLPGAT